MTRTKYLAYNTTLMQDSCRSDLIMAANFYEDDKTFPNLIIFSDNNVFRKTLCPIFCS